MTNSDSTKEDTCAFSPERQCLEASTKEKVDAPHLFSPFKLRSVSFRNRIGVSPMCQYFSDDGMVSDWHLVHLGSRAIGGAALVIVEATAVTRDGRISPDDNGIYKEEHVEPLRKITNFITTFGAVPGIQLAHAGRKASTLSPWKGGSRSVKVDLTDDQGGWEIVGPSAIPFSPNSRVPRELTISDIKSIQESFRIGADRALRAGFQFLEIHAAHGYLLHSFYSPISNKRTDEYGGSFENRIRFLVETTKIVRKQWPENLPLSVRLSCSDWVDGGWTITDSAKLANILKELGVDIIDCSSGYVSSTARYPHGPGWQVPFAEEIRESAKIATAAVGEITDAKQADEIISMGKADIVLLARQMMRDPYWPYHAAQELHQVSAETLPKQYKYAI